MAIQAIVDRKCPQTVDAEAILTVREGLLNAHPARVIAPSR